MNEYLLPAMLGFVVLAVLLVIAVRLVRAKNARGGNRTGDSAAARNVSPPQQQLEKLLATGRYTGVLIQSGCQFSSYLAGTKFPIEDAPRLPLAGCESEHCTCIYVGLPDRRKSGERRSGSDRRLALRLGLDRRARTDRRRSAGSWNDQYSH